MATGQILVSGNGLLQPSNLSTVAGGTQPAGNPPLLASLPSASSAPPGTWQYTSDSGMVFSNGSTWVIDTGFLTVEQFGAVGDGVTDDTVAFQATALAAKNAGYVDIQLGPKNYLISSTIFANGSDNGLNTAPLWRGYGVDNTSIIYPNIAVGSPAFKFRGGSGHNAMKVVVDGVAFKGNATSIGVMFSGTNSMRTRDCRYLDNLYGVEFHNETSGSFTEFCWADHCQFTGACLTPVHYRTTSGNSSHHGSGMVNQCLVSISTGTVVLVDANAQPYQAPLDAVIFPTGAATLVTNNRASAPIIDFIGTIRCELSGGTLTLGAVNRVYFQGPIGVVGVTNTTGAGFTAGTLLRVKSVAIYQNSSTLATGFEGEQTIAITTGANTLTSLFHAHRLVYVKLSNANAGGTYDYRYVLSVDHNGFGLPGYVAIVATLSTINTAGYGDPVFTVDTSGNLVATQAAWPASGVTCWMYESGMAGNISGGNAILY